MIAVLRRWLRPTLIDDQTDQRDRLTDQLHRAATENRQLHLQLLQQLDQTQTLLQRPPRGGDK